MSSQTLCALKQNKRLIIVEKENKSLKATNQELLKKMEDKFQSFDNKIELLRKSIELKEDKISSLETKVNDQEVLFNEKLEKLSREKKFKCDKCDYETNKESTLHNHKSKKHQKNTEMDDSIFPKQCDLCEIVLNNNKEMKNHRRTHSFNYVTFKCALCDFIGGEQIDMEIHDARVHSDKHECALCDFEGKDLETIDIHLTTCECYSCGLCENKFKQLSQVKEHFKNTHKESKQHSFYGVKHIKQSRKSSDIYDQKFHSISTLFPDN